MEPDDPDEPMDEVHVELTDELDLHPFHPRDIRDIVLDYVHHASGKGWSQVRIIHGKGIGAARQTVHRALSGHPAVARLVAGGEGGGGWGATRVGLRPLPVTVRPLHDGDSFAELTDLLHAAYAPLGRRGMRFVATWQDEGVTRSRCLAGDTFLAEAGGRIVGTVTWYPAEKTDGSPWYDRPGVSCLGQWAVDPAWQGRGIGRRLLEAVERRALEAGAEHLALDTSEHAAELIATYERRGYAFIEHAQWKETNYRSVILSRRLVPGPGEAGGG